MPAQSGSTSQVPAAPPMTHPAVGGLALAVYYAFVTPVALVARALGIGRRAVGTPAWIERDDRADSPRRT